MENGKTSVLSNGMIWFGAAVTIAEMITGSYLAPLGFAKGIFAIVSGHIIGAVLMYFTGMIGAKYEKSSMDTVKSSFGSGGSKMFALINVLQLVGWTAVMIKSGASAAFELSGAPEWIWCAVIGALIILWVLIGIKGLGKVNIVAIGSLFVLTVVLSATVFGKGGNTHTDGEISFGTAVELSATMAISWLPLVSDYTRNAAKKRASVAVSALAYFAGSSWMYIIGMASAIFTGESDIAKVMKGAGLGIAGLMTVIFSTVTTTFMDAYSGGASCGSISKRLHEKPAAVAVCIIGTVLAVFTRTEGFETFLYLIGSVFVPMIAIQLTDNFIIKTDSGKRSFDLVSLGVWVIGVALYRIFLRIDTPVGNTLPVMCIVCILTVSADKLFKRDGREEK